jgi:hypothetical protein
MFCTKCGQKQEKKEPKNTDGEQSEKEKPKVPPLTVTQSVNDMKSNSQAPPTILPLSSPKDGPEPRALRQSGNALRRSSVALSPRGGGGGSALSPRDLQKSPREAGAGSRRSEIRKTMDLTAANANYLAGEEVERKAKKGSFRESMVLPMKNLRESMLISAEEREAALAKIDEMLGNTGLFVFF